MRIYIYSIFFSRDYNRDRYGGRNSLEEIRQAAGAVGRLSADRGGMQWLGLPALDAATGDQPDKFPHPYRLDAAHIDSR